MDDKLKDPQTKAKAAIWQTKTAEIKVLSEAMEAYIDTLEIQLKTEKGLTNDDYKKYSDKEIVSDIFLNQNKAVELNSNLVRFKKELIGVFHPEQFAIYPYLQKELTKYVRQLNTSMLTYIGNNNISDNSSNHADSIREYFKNTSAIGALVILDKIKNDIAIMQNNMLGYCYSQTPAINHGFELFSFIATQNSSYLKKGQLHEIVAGMGSFTATMQPSITINGYKIPIDNEGVATYRQKIKDKPGKHFIVVSIEFTRPDGAKAKLNKSIAFTVAE